MWLIYFDDASMKPEIFTDEDAAQNRFAMLEINWKVTLFKEAEPE